MKMIEMKDNVSKRLNKLKSLQRILQSPRFNQATEIKSLNIQDLDFINYCIEYGDTISLRKWIRERLDDPYIAEIRRRASELKVPNYSRLEKEVLYPLVKEYENHIKEASE
jgi:hypothetical protein